MLLSWFFSHPTDQNQRQTDGLTLVSQIVKMQILDLQLIAGSRECSTR
jgi:hypothetical protein